MIMVFLDPDNKILSLCSKQSLTGSRTTGGALHLSVWSCWGRLVYIHQQSSSSSSYTSLCQHTAVQQSETQDWPESSTEGIIWLIQLLNTAMLAPSHRQISTTFYLHAQFVASFATCDSVPTLTSRRVWHFIIAKLSNEKFSFRLLFFIFIFFFFSKRSKRQQHGASCWHHRRGIHCHWQGKKQAQVSLCLRHSGSLLFSTQTHQRW